ncbi:GPW/gp25 family protein [Myxococcota bacterium]|nr:GPW/gp25 family protein [Myxococcota bacterium]MBU1900025.1 GPW/gp25 family protein [Myxococcota bacterium]
MSKSFLGKGFAFPLGVDGGGGMRLSAHEENIQQCVQIILGTAPGERVYRPQFGCKIHDYIFAPNNDHNRNMISYYAREALLKWEPRIEAIEVEVHSDLEQPNVVSIHIRYMVKSTNSHYNLVYPFFLRREDEP